MMIHAVAIGSLILSAGLTDRASANSPDTLDARISARVQQEMEAQNIVGLSVGIVTDAMVQRTLHFGWEDREDAIETSDATMYRWASISKPLTAIVALQLWNEGKLDLDKDVRAYVPEFPKKEWPITSRQLLGHRGGIVHYTNGRVIRTEREYDVEHPFADTILALDDFKESPLVCQPGTKFSYSTRGYMLLGAVVQRAGGDTYANLVRTRIIDPLGMKTLRPDHQWEQIDHRTPGYRRGPDGTRIRSSNTDVSWKLPGGGFISNVHDLATFAAALTDNSLIDKSTAAIAFEPLTTSTGDRSRYGLGFAIGELDGMKTVGHTGSQEKTRTSMLTIPAKQCAVVIMCNTEGTNLRALTADLLRLIVESIERADEPPLRQAA